MNETAAAMLREAKTELKRAEKAVAQAKRLVAAASDELDKPTTDTQEGHRDDHRIAAALH